jgi:glycosyltransferase involved in cell wall biosynthesis
MLCSYRLIKRFCFVLAMLAASAVVWLAYDIFHLGQHFLTSHFHPAGAHRLAHDELERYVQKSAAILVCMGRGDAGMERCALAQLEAFTRAGVDVALVCHRSGYIAKKAIEAKLPIVTCSNAGVCSKRFAWLPGVEHAVTFLRKRFGSRLLAVQCNMPRELFAAKRALRGTSIPAIFTQHTMHNIVSKELRQAADGFIGMSKGVADLFADLNLRDGIACPMLALPPYFAYERFLDIKPQASREVFFRQHFGVALKPVPLLLKVAHLYPEIHIKNHPLLLQAMHELIYKRGLTVQVALAGSGKQGVLKKMVHALGLEGYVHFLGCTDKTPELFFYADVSLLASSNEAGGTALIEGGMLAKPTIAATKTGAAGWLITDQETGFLFENNNALSLADTIAAVLTDPSHAQACGQRLQKRVLSDFLPPQTVAKTIAFYRAVGAGLAKC